MFQLCIFVLLLSSGQLHAHEAEVVSNQLQIDQSHAAEFDLLDELDRKTEDIITRSHTTLEDMNKEAHIPTWKKWMMQAGDVMYWTYQTGVDAVQSLCQGCKKVLTGSTDESEKKSA